MKKFSKLLLFLMDREKEIASQLVQELEAEDPHAVLTNAVHEEIYLLLEYGYSLIKDQVFDYDLEPPQQRHLKIVK